MLFYNFTSSAQAKNEDELKKQADKYFENEDYNLAYKLYAQLVSNYPKDPEYNYRLGVCMLFTEPDKKKPYSYLKIATTNQKEVPKDALFYLAKTYHMNYKFDEAIKLYTEYKAIGSSASVKKLQVDREIEACKNGKRLLANLSDLVIITKKQLNEADYFRSYDLKDIGGKLLVKPEEFRTSIDKKKKEKSVIYLPRVSERIYYSSYGENGDKGRDIFFINKLPNGAYSKPQPMPGPINTEYDEDYPFLHPNGKTLYFSSKGHNSMGGYDVFKTTFNEGTQTWSKPLNLDFPINSPDDDILFVTDSLEKNAYFSTGRYSPYGKIDVLKINTERRPMNYAFLKGTVVKEDVGQSLKSKITVKNIANGEIVGTYQAQDNGDYSMEIPNGGKFIFTVETPGIPTQSEGVNIPIAYNLKPYKQLISYDKKILKIINYFDGQIADENYSVMLDLIEKKAKLEINENEPYNNGLKNQNTGTENTNIDAVKTNNPTVANSIGNSKTNTNKNVTNEQLLEMAKTDAKEATDEAVKLKKEAEDAFGLATQKTAEATAKQKEADEAIIKANTISDITIKNAELKKANDLKDDAKIATDVANTATNMAKRLEVDANQQQQEADLTNQYIKEIETVTKNKNNKEAVTKLEQIQKQLDDLSKQKNQSDELLSSLKAESELKIAELKKSEKKSNDIITEINVVTNSTKELDKDLVNENDVSLKESIKAQIKELTIDNDENKKELTVNNEKIEKLKNELEGINKEIEISAKMMNEKTDAIAIDDNIKNEGAIAVSKNKESTDEDAGIDQVALLSYEGITSKYKNIIKPTDKLKTKEDAIKQNDILKNSITDATNLLSNNKKELAASKDDSEKKILKDDIKNLEKYIKENEKQITANTSKAKTLGNADELANTNAKQDNQNNINITETTINGNENVINNNTATNTSTALGNQNLNTIDAPTDKDNTAYLNKLQDLKNNLNTNNATNIFAYNDYKENTTIALKETANKKFDIAKQNDASINALITKTETDIKNNTANTGNSAESLQMEADVLTDKAANERKDAATKSGIEKDKLIAQAKDDEKLASDKKLQASVLLAKQHKEQFENNAFNLSELKKINSANTSNELSNANLLIDEAVVNFNQADKLRKEANANTNASAKLGGLNNAEEKENEALVKQQKALDILSKANPNYKLKIASVASNPNAAIANVNNEINNASQYQTEAYLALSKANQNELKLQGEKITQNKNYTKTEFKQAEDFKKLSDNLNTEALALITNAIETTNEKNKATLLFKANEKEIAALTELNKATEILKQNKSIVSENDLSTALNNQNGNADTNKNTNTTNTVTPSNTNENAISNTDVVVVNTNTETPVNTTNNNTNANPTDLKNSLNNNAENGLTQFNAYTNADAISLNKQATEKIKLALTEDKNLITEIDNLKTSAASSSQNNLNPNASQANINTLTNDADKLNNDAFMLRKGAATKTGEEKTKDLNDAKTIDASALAKKKEAALLQQQLNDATYEANKQSLNELAELAKGKNITELNNANTTISEIEILNNQAINLREEANANASEAAKIGGFGNAEEKENLAIQKQESLLAIYKKYFSNYVPKTPTVNTQSPESIEKYNATSDKVNTNTQQHIAGLTLLSQANEKEYKSRFLNLPSTLSAPQSALKTNAQAAYKKNQSLISEANETSNPNEKKNKLVEATKNGQEAINLLNKIAGNEPIASNNDSGTNLNNNNNNNINNNNTASANSNTRTAANTNNGNTASTNSNTRTTTNNTALNNTTSNAVSNQNANTVKIKVEGLEVKNTNAYTATKPIPIDEKMPDGLVFKVQIGAFKQPLPNNQFKGLSPVVGQTTPNGYIRYMAGEFKKYESANAVKNDLNNLGYSDAFVVAYYNGVRIDLNEAGNKAKQTGQPQEIKVNNNLSAGLTSNANVPRNSINTTVAANEQVTVQGELEKLNGLLYTVQIGVYSKQITRTQLKNLTPIYTEQLPSGLYRYTAGIYNQQNKLIEDKRKVVELGVKDAFISSYYNGKKIAFAEGQKLQAENNNLKMETQNPIQFNSNVNSAINATLPVNTNNAATTPLITNTVSAFTNGVTNAPTPTAENGVKTDDIGISFKVQIGAYRYQVPNDVASKFLAIKNWPINNVQINGLYIYTFGNFNAVSFAKKLRDEAVSIGISDAYITVYKDGKKLYGTDASNYLNK